MYLSRGRGRERVRVGWRRGAVVQRCSVATNVPGKVRDRVGDVVVGHGQDGDLRDGPVAAVDAPGTLVDGRQVGVHVPGVPAAAGHLLACGRDLAQGVGVRRHVGEDDEDVQVLLVRQVPGGVRGGELLGTVGRA
jgi:hypothetical protein